MKRQDTYGDELKGQITYLQVQRDKVDAMTGKIIKQLLIILIVPTIAGMAWAHHVSDKVTNAHISTTQGAK